MTNRIRQLYCLGLGGVGVSAIAKYWLAQGVRVSGSDAVKSPVIDDAVNSGAVYVGQDNDPRHITKDFDLVVYTDACRSDHPELAAAHQAGIPTKNFSAALANIMEEYRVRVAVCGTNGKSTTTALAGLLLAEAGWDPTVFVGSRVTGFNGNLRLGGRQLFVAEADEWRDHFHALQPTVLAITNLELDHPDYFTSLDQLVQSFQMMVDRLPADGHLVINLDDPVGRQWSRHPRAVTVGQADADLTHRIIRTGPAVQEFSATWRGQPLGTFALHVPGAFNVANASLAMAIALTLGAGPDTFRTTLEKFRGIWRRFEVIRLAQPTIILDYAHHPTAIRVTLTGAREFYPARRVIAVFQPHLHQRLTTLFPDFVQAFARADRVIIQSVYAVLGREQVADMKTGADLAEAIRQTGKLVEYAENTAATRRHLESSLQPNDVVVIMGAGDIWTLAEQLAQRYAR